MKLRDIYSFCKRIGRGSCQGYVFAAPRGFPHRGKPRLVNLLALTSFGLEGEPWPLASSTCCSNTTLPPPQEGRKIYSPAFLLFYFLTFLLLSGCSQRPYYKETRLLMGTFVEITCQDNSAIEQAFQEIRKIEAAANNFEPSSEISRLNKDGEIKAGADLLAMVRESLKYYRLSRGAFDITVGPLARLWKEMIKQADEGLKEIEIPSAQEISATLALIGSDKIILDEPRSVIKFSRPGVEIDLGGIAKGYAVDKAVMRLKELGITSAMVNAGGNIYCLGKKHSRKWRIGIQHPRKPQEILFYLELENQAVATSGDYQQYFSSKGRRYSHIIDPKSGYPVDNGVISATIIALDGASSDGLSTSVFVLGKEKGQELVKSLKGVEARIIEEKDI